VSTKWYQDILTEYSRGLESVVEFGTWNGQGAVIFANAGVKDITTCDINLDHVDQEKIKSICGDIKFNKENSLNPSKKYEADLIFFDTMHTYEHVIKELRVNAEGAKKYFAVHDTNYPPPRKSPKKLVRDAVLEYLEENKNFVLELEDKTSTGIMIAKRK
jgi:cephalosporin hydroxylase